MTQRQCIEEIFDIAKQMGDPTVDECDLSPEDAYIYDMGLIMRLCNKALGRSVDYAGE